MSTRVPGAAVPCARRRAAGGGQPVPIAPRVPKPAFSLSAECGIERPTAFPHAHVRQQTAQHSLGVGEGFAQAQTVQASSLNPDEGEGGIRDGGLQFPLVSRDLPGWLVTRAGDSHLI